MNNNQVTEAIIDWIDNYIYNLTHIVLYPPTVKADWEDAEVRKEEY